MKISILILLVLFGTVLGQFDNLFFALIGALCWVLAFGYGMYGGARHYVDRIDKEDNDA